VNNILKITHYLLYNHTSTTDDRNVMITDLVRWCRRFRSDLTSTQTDFKNPRCLLRDAFYFWF